MYVDLETPFKGGRIGKHGSKYAELFDKLPLGKSVSCSEKNANAVSKALRAYLQRNKKTGRVLTEKNGDRINVFWLPSKSQ